MQQGDVLLEHTQDGGEIYFENDFIVFTGGLETAAYISLFGGNDQDDGSSDNPFNWWGNTIEKESKYKIRSQTAFLLRNIPAAPYNLRRIENAVKADLSWLIEIKAANSLEASCRIIALNTIEISIQINAIGSENNFKFVENWRSYQ